MRCTVSLLMECSKYGILISPLKPLVMVSGRETDRVPEQSDKNSLLVNNLLTQCRDHSPPFWALSGRSTKVWLKGSDPIYNTNNQLHTVIERLHKS